MKIGYYVFILSMVMTRSFGQTVDTTYVASYKQKVSITGFVATNAIEIRENKNYYRPNYPLTIGVGLAAQNTVLNMKFGYGLVALKGKEFGETKSMDFQLHRYGRHFMLDLFFQRYKGFYQQGKNNEEVLGLYPDLSVRQIGAEGTYLFNGEKFSAKAAFEQREIQLQSVGSFLLGGGIYLYKLGLDKSLLISELDHIDNFQLGVNAGYAYSWVASKRWLLSAMATIGTNFGNEPELLKDWKIKAYPTVFARGSAGYHKADWAVSLSFFIHNKSVYAFQKNVFNIDNNLNLTSLNIQLAYVKHLDRFFKKKNRQ